MPQVDLETLVCGGGVGSGDGRVSCETLIGLEGTPEKPPAATEEDPYLPPESFQVRIGDEIGLVDISVVYDREDSTKGNTNPKSHQQNSHQKPRSNSQRFSGSLKPKAPIIGLPNKIQHSGYLAHSARCQTKGRIFPKGGGGGGRGPKSAVPTYEPGSPKVSCFGKVLSDRERDRSRTLRQDSREEEEGRAGCWATLAAFFRCGWCYSGGERAVGYVEEEESSSAASGSIPAATGKMPAEASIAAAPGLGGMKRFTSGRRTASWGGDADVGDADGHVAWSGPLDREAMRGRRSVGSLEEASRDREW